LIRPELEIMGKCYPKIISINDEGANAIAFEKKKRL
jgi:hypothetical protein